MAAACSEYFLFFSQDSELNLEQESGSDITVIQIEKSIVYQSLKYPVLGGEVDLVK